ncbi:hypothetical protein KNE206_65850 [Kitasatospora sp. NE20-6]
MDRTIQAARDAITSDLHLLFPLLADVAAEARRRAGRPGGERPAAGWCGGVCAQPSCWAFRLVRCSWAGLSFA